MNTKLTAARLENAIDCKTLDMDYETYVSYLGQAILPDYLAVFTMPEKEYNSIEI